MKSAIIAVILMLLSVSLFAIDCPGKVELPGFGIMTTDDVEDIVSKLNQDRRKRVKVTMRADWYDASEDDETRVGKATAYLYDDGTFIMDTPNKEKKLVIRAKAEKYWASDSTTNILLFYHHSYKDQGFTFELTPEQKNMTLRQLIVQAKFSTPLKYNPKFKKLFDRKKKKQKEARAKAKELLLECRVDKEKCRQSPTAYFSTWNRPKSAFAEDEKMWFYESDEKGVFFLPFGGSRTFDEKEYYIGMNDEKDRLRYEIEVSEPEFMYDKEDRL